MVKQKTIIIIALALVVIMFLLPDDIAQTKTKPTEDWQKTYINKTQQNLTSYTTNVANTNYYDLENDVISKIAKEIKMKSKSEKEAVENTLKYVFDNIDYVSGEADEACFEGTAPKIIASGKGQCDTQSITVISLLRKMGIATRPVGGCVLVKPKCGLQSIFLNSLQAVGGAPKYQEITEVDSTKDIFSRAQLSSRKGGLHAWVEAYLDGEWVALESTQGRLADTRCYNYHVEILPDNNQKRDICVSKNYNYALACSQNNLEGLEEYKVAK
tara:strand:+ start:885 stop:1697 length:813 start_codon:yes stop_codon:yes gene_type:complete